MSDFAARLEQELHAAAVRQESAGRLRGVALPRLRVAVPGLAASAVAAVALALALAGVATVVLRTAPEPSSVPAELEGEWRLPVRLGVEGGQQTAQTRNARGVNSLLLLPAGSERCASLGIESACYLIDDTLEGALEWGVFEISDDVLEFRGADGISLGAPATYRWRIDDRALTLTELNEESGSVRRDAFGAGPLTRPGQTPPTAEVPPGWTGKRLASDRYGYRIQYPADWSVQAAARDMPEGGLAVDTSDAVHKLSVDPAGTGTPVLMVTAYRLPAGTGLDEFTASVNDVMEREGGCPSGEQRSEVVDGRRGTITLYNACNRRSQQLVTLVHGNRGYQIAWWGEPGRVDADGPLFDALLSTFEFSD